MFWTGLAKFCRDVFQTLSVPVGMDLMPNPLLALFDTIEEINERLTLANRRIVSFISLLARRTILLTFHFT